VKADSAEDAYLAQVYALGVNGSPAKMVQTGHEVCKQRSLGAPQSAMADALLTGSRNVNGADAVTADQAAGMVAFAIDTLCPGPVSAPVQAPQPVSQPQPAAQPGPPAPEATSSNRTMGATTDANPFSRPDLVGYCTYGAQEKVKENAGYYIAALTGAAYIWADQARNAGWTVVTDAEPRSIVVFDPPLAGNPNGHVAWVDNVEQRADGRYVTITEMNYGPGASDANGYHTSGFNQFHTRTVKDVPGMSYILIP
jgi:surface antigen